MNTHEDLIKDGWRCYGKSHFSNADAYYCKKLPSLTQCVHNEGKDQQIVAYLYHHGSHTGLEFEISGGILTPDGSEENVWFRATAGTDPSRWPKVISLLSSAWKCVDKAKGGAA